MTVSLWSNHMHEEVAWQNSFQYIIFWFHKYDEDLSLAEYILENHSIRDLVVASKWLIQLVYNNNNLVDTFICIWLSSYNMVGIFFFKEKSHIFWIWCVIESQLDAFSTSFMVDYYFCIVWWNVVFEIELYTNQTNIPHLCNQSVLTWIIQNKINPCLWSFEDIQVRV